MRYYYLSILLLLFSANTFSQTIHLSEDFNAATLPTGWTNNAASGSQAWSFGINASASTSGNSNINGTPLAYFDDDALGASNTNNTTSLTTPTFDNSQDSLTFLEFDYNFRAYNGIADSFYVDVFDGSQWNRVFSRANDDCGNWIAPACAIYPHAKIDISAYANANCQIRFIYHDGNDWGWGVGLDNVKTSSPLQNDVGITSIRNLNNNCLLDDSLSVTIKNYGTKPQSNIQLAYAINNGPANNFTFNGNISPFDSVAFTIPSQLSLNSGISDIAAYTLLSNDQELANDSAGLRISKSLINSLPYFEDFEGANSVWNVSGRSASWEVGQPNATKLNYAASGFKAAVTNLSGNYNNNELSYISSPCIQLGNTAVPLRISFDSWRELENGFDLVWLEYSLDGSNWIKVIEDSIYTSNNWYNNAMFSSWSGVQTNSYQRSEVVLRDVLPSSFITFRFAMKSDGSAALEGFGFDNFKVEELDQFEMAVNSVSSPITTLCRLTDANVEIELENRGFDTILSAQFQLSINSGNTIIDSLRKPIPPGIKTRFVFDTLIDFRNIPQVNITTWSNLSGDTLALNDTASLSFSNTIPTGVLAPFVDDFSNPTHGSWYSTSGWIYSQYFQGTPSTITGPNKDANGDGSFIYLNSTSDVFIESYCIDLRNLNDPVLSFLYHKYGVNVPDLIVEVFDGVQWIQVDSILGQTQISSDDPWKGRTISLDPFKERNIRVRFTARQNNPGLYDDMALDYVRIEEYTPDSLYFLNRSYSSLNCQNSDSVKFQFQFFFEDSIPIDKDSITFEIYANNTLLRSEQPNTDFLGMNFYTYSLNNTIDLSPYSNNSFNIKYQIKFIRNSKIYLDSLIDTVSLSQNQLPYYNGFENLFVQCLGISSIAPNFDISEGWYTEPETPSKWHVSDSTECYFNTVYGPSATYDRFSGPSTVKSGNAFVYYDHRSGNQFDTVSLMSPCFNLSAYNQAYLSFDYSRYYQGPSMGFLKLDVKHNGSWIQIARIDTVWTTPSHWESEVIDITNYLGSNVQFRFYMDSVPFRVHTAIDAFKIYDPLATNVESLKTHTHTLSVYPNPNSGEFKIEVPEELIGLHYEIIDLSGKILKNSNFKRSIENIQIEADTGIYILRVPGMGVVEKIVVY